jgi:hypothetical protein
MTIMQKLPALSAERRRNRLVRACSATAAVAGLALFAAGCGGSSGPGVAGVASTTATTSAASPSSGSNASNPAAFSNCMRSHGVPLFPDPNSKGALSPGSGVDPNSPQFRKAGDACRSLLPRGGGYSTASSSRRLTPQQQGQLLSYAKCMRSHGLPKFPDPSSHGIALDAGQIDVNSPQFVSAQQACRSLLPKLGPGTNQTTGGSGSGH